MISPSELVSQYGWGKATVQEAATALRQGKMVMDSSLQQYAQTVTIAMLQWISRIQQRPTPSSLQEFEELETSFSQIWAIADQTESMIVEFSDLEIQSWQEATTTGPASTSASESLDPGPTISPRISAIPMAIKASMLFEATRMCAGSEYPGAKELLVATRRRFVRWLKIFILMMSDPQFTSNAEGNHSRAILLAILDLAPFWMELVVEAATNFSSGDGPYADLKLSWDDLKMLRKELVYSSTVFDRSSRQLKDLSVALARAGQSDTCIWDGGDKDCTEFGG
ncbi:glycine-rich domain-containing protein 2 [Pseudohyphozyma bogoriensis]|nr:glycine-rich domain-containing protein 2 [Pseudohyphozyma bogoriensis]